MRRALFPLLVLLLASGCARDMSSTVYSENSLAGKVIEGRVISTRNVTIKGNDKLQDNTAGILAGGVSGGVAGSAFGNGTGNTATTVAGALIGAAAGAFAEDQLSTSEGVEYLVKIDKAYVQEYRSITKRIQTSGKESVQQSLNAADTPTKTDIVSVVQKGDPSLRIGSPVYVIYSDDRPRLTLKQ